MQKLLFDGDYDKSISELIRDDNYKELVSDESRLCRTQQMVYDTLYGKTLCDKQIAVLTGLPISSVCGRRNELVKMGLIEPSDEPIEYPDYTGCMRLNTGWRHKNGNP